MNGKVLCTYNNLLYSDYIKLILSLSAINLLAQIKLSDIVNQSLYSSKLVPKNLFDMHK